jgi:hypothetical protein
MLVANARDLDRVRAIAVPTRDSQPWRVAFAPGGRAVFTEVKGSYDASPHRGRDQVGILQGGRVREMQLPPSRSRRGLYGVAVQANRAYVTASGTLIELELNGGYAEIPAPGAAYTEIVSNARRVVFASSSAAVLEEFVPGGKHPREIPLDVPRVRIKRLTFCAPDDLWAGVQTEQHTAAVGRIDARGHVELYDAGAGQITGLACPRHDDVWFVTQRPDRVGRIRAGQLRSWPLTPGTEPIGLAILNDRRLVTATRQGFVEFDELR